MNKTKLQKILKSLTPDETKVDFSSFDNEINKLKESLKEKITVKTLEDVNIQLTKFSRRINFEPVLTAFDELKTNITDKNSQLLSALDEKLVQLGEVIKQSNEQANQSDQSLKAEIDTLLNEVSVLSARKVEIPDFGKQIKDTETKLLSVIDTAKILDTLQDEKEKEVVQTQFVEVEKKIKEVKSLFQQVGRGGSMNRNIAIGGNTSVLSRYTDINLKAGSNVTITYTNNNTTKYTDITIASSGGGGSVGGTVRQIQTLTVSSQIGTLTGTDQVYLVNGGLQITLPTAVSDTNLYTIKNVGSSSVLINTVSAQTIDTQSTIIMPIQFTSVDIVSDNSNWNIT